ncbi:hypothetical protein F5Y15DRAFT_392110 [Xylariaceae sp. FL0016]|nr:hypothetical protein F5Y15DRAFT_392110 [Xylariaceae sp. FL0016]
MLQFSCFLQDPFINHLWLLFTLVSLAGIRGTISIEVDHETTLTIHNYPSSYAGDLSSAQQQKWESAYVYSPSV